MSEKAMTQIIALWKRLNGGSWRGKKKGLSSASGLLSEAFRVLVRHQVPAAEFTHSNHRTTSENAFICFSFIVSGMKNKKIRQQQEKKKKHLQADSSSRFLQPFANLAPSRCELYWFLVLMLLRCARRKTLWSGTDLYQSMQMLDVGAGAGRAPPPAPPTVTETGGERNGSSDLYWTAALSSSNLRARPTSRINCRVKLKRQGSWGHRRQVNHSLDERWNY